jgi:hypothetical protein
MLLWLLAAVAAQQFIDLAPKSIFTYTTNNGFAGRKYFPQPLCGGIAVFDYDNDGMMDLYLTNGAPFPSLKKTPRHYNALLRNKGNGEFEDATARAGLTGELLGYSMGAAAGDFDNDGFTDLFVANIGANTLYRNNGKGAFLDVTARAGLSKPPNTLSVQGAWLDYDNDGDLDLVLSNYTLWTPETDRRCVREDGVEFYCHPKTYPAVPHRLYRNLGGGRFEDVTEAAGFANALGKGMGIAIADFNADGFADIFLANDTERNFLYVNQQDGTFKEQGLLLGAAYNDDAATVSAMGADAKDYDNDGRPDIFYNDLMVQIWGLFRNTNGKSFRYTSPAAGLVRLSQPYSGWSGGFIDYDNDGWKDLYSANGDVDSLRDNAAQHDTMFRNIEGRFTDVSQQMGKDFLPKGYQRGAAFADFNNDGWMDVAVTSLGRRPRILLNQPGSNNWLLLAAPGAAVKITTPSGRTLHNHSAPSVGLLSSSDPRIHFGLGQEASADVELHWPGGAVETRKGVPANQILDFKNPNNLRNASPR